MTFTCLPIDYTLSIHRDSLHPLFLALDPPPVSTFSTKYSSLLCIMQYNYKESSGWGFKANEMMNDQIKLFNKNVTKLYYGNLMMNG